MTLHTDLLSALSDFRDELAEILTEHTPGETATPAAEPEAPILPTAWRRGDVISSPVAIPHLPAGTVLKDSDGDNWYKHDTGFLNMIEDDADYNDSGDLAYFLPATIVSVRPVAEPLADWERELLAGTPAQREPKLGDRVIAKTLFPGYMASRQGVTGTISRVDAAYDDQPKGYVVSLDHPDYNYLGTKATEVELIGPEVEPIAPKIKDLQEAEAAEPTLLGTVGDTVKVTRTLVPIVSYRQGQDGVIERHEVGLPWVKFPDGGMVIAAEIAPATPVVPEWKVPRDSYTGSVDYGFTTENNTDKGVLVQTGYQQNGTVYLQVTDAQYKEEIGVWISREEADRLVKAIQAVTTA